MPRGACRDRPPRSHRAQHRRGPRDRRLPRLGGALAEARRRGDDARQPHAVPRRRRAREPAARARAGLGAAVRGGGRGRAPAVLAARAQPAEGIAHLLLGRPGRTRPDPVLELVDAHVQPDAVAPVRQLPRRRRPGRAGRHAARRQGRDLAGAAAQHGARAVPRGSGVLAAVDDQPDGTVCNVTTIITYGRPGTPMQAWGRRAAARRTTSRSRISSRSCARSSSSPPRSRRSRRRTSKPRARPIRRPRARST